MTELHDEEFKVRLTEADAAILRAFARKRRTKPAVVLREWAAAQIDRLAYSVPSSSENRRPAEGLPRSAAANKQGEPWRGNSRP